MADPNETHTVLNVSKTATVALAAHRFVILSSDTEGVEYPGAQYAWAFGITRHAATIGQTVEVAVMGIVPLQVDGNAANIVAGDGLTAHNGTDGYGQKAAGAASRAVSAQALAASTADGDVIPVQLCRYLTTA